MTLVYLRLRSVRQAWQRVQNRVLQGGHFIPGDVIRRRYRAGWHNFRKVYSPLMDEWFVYDNTGPVPVLLEQGRRK